MILNTLLSSFLANSYSDQQVQQTCQINCQLFSQSSCAICCMLVICTYLRKIVSYQTCSKWSAPSFSAKFINDYITYSKCQKQNVTCINLSVFAQPPLPSCHENTNSCSFISTPPCMGCQSIAGLTPSTEFTSTHIYTWAERGTVKVKCLAHEYNTMPLDRT